MERSFKKFCWITLTGALLGGVLSTWLSPKAIAWYFNPPANFGVSCTEAIVWALERLQWSQLLGLCGGSVVGVVAFFLLTKSSQKMKPPNESLPVQ